MSEMQQGAATAQIAPAAPATPAAPTPLPSGGVTVAGGGPQAPTAGIDLSGFSANQLRRMLSELGSQRSELASRRQTIGETYERATGDSREGIGERIRTLDKNIVDYEIEIARVGRALAAKSGGESSQLPPGSNRPGPGWMREDDAAGMAFGFSFMTLVLAIFFTRRFMRKRYGRMPTPQQQTSLQSNERLDRIEQAVDTIAVEIERVSENQRFMTRLMTETQLGDTIKDVRKSAELAKSAAADSPR